MSICNCQGGVCQFDPGPGFECRQTSKAGLKYDDDRPQIEKMVLAYFPRALAAIATVSEFGARKYAYMGWRTVPNGVERYTDAMARHQLKEYTEGPYDETDSGLSHAAQRAWNALARLEMMLAQGLVEDRVGNTIVGGKPVLGTARERGKPAPVEGLQEHVAAIAGRAPPVCPDLDGDIWNMPPEMLCPKCYKHPSECFCVVDKPAEKG